MKHKDYMFHFWFHSFTFPFLSFCKGIRDYNYEKEHNESDLSLPQCFQIAPTVFSNRSHSVFESLPQCF